jgi:hypothetical protein
LYAEYNGNRQTGLNELRAAVVDRAGAPVWADRLTPQDQAKPRLHITVQNKVEPAIAKALFAELSAGFEPRSLQITGFAAHYYRGGPWEYIQDWKFSGRR